MDFGRVLGGGSGNFHGFDTIQLEDPGVLGEGRVRVKPSPKGCGIYFYGSKDLKGMWDVGSWTLTPLNASALGRRIIRIRSIIILDTITMLALQALLLELAEARGSFMSFQTTSNGYKSLDPAPPFRSVSSCCQPSVGARGFLMDLATDPPVLATEVEG